MSLGPSSLFGLEQHMELKVTRKACLLKCEEVVSLIPEM